MRLPTICPPDRVPREGETIFTRVTSRSKPDYAIDPETGCWVWQKFLLRGYPMSGSNGRVHRLYFIRAYGEDALPQGWDVHHKCENRACLNPEHLEAAHASWHRRRHQLAHKGKLTWDEAREIRRIVQTEPQTSYPTLAKRYGVSVGHVQDIAEGIAFYEPGVRWLKPVRACVVCGVDITESTRRQAKYCGKDCRVKANRSRKR